MDFEKLMNQVSDTEGVKGIDAIKDVNDTNKESSETNESVEQTETSDILSQGDIQMSWTKVNTSGWCGCNNACFNSCDNVR